MYTLGVAGTLGVKEQGWAWSRVWCQDAQPGSIGKSSAQHWHPSWLGSPTPRLLKVFRPGYISQAKPSQ